MCGIGGFFSKTSRGEPTARQVLVTMNEIQRHRGPDGNGIWHDRSGLVGLAHTRLSIIDLSESAAQPMTAANGNVIAFNGEIYNYLELKKTLGGTFNTTSDTEVILRAYERW